MRPDARVQYCTVLHLYLHTVLMKRTAFQSLLLMMGGGTVLVSSRAPRRPSTVFEGSLIWLEREPSNIVQYIALFAYRTHETYRTPVLTPDDGLMGVRVRRVRRYADEYRTVWD